MNKKLLFGLLSFALLTMLLGACKIIDASTLPKATEVEMGSSQFIQQEVTIHKGENINLVNQPTTNHVIANGQWVNGAQDQKPEANAPSLPQKGENVAASASLQVGPFNTAGEYHIYCNIHPGMNLIVHVT
jgi:plastocyanin